MNAVDVNVYPDFKYVEELSPSCLYIPNKEIMFKMMRACIKVRSAAEVWVLNDEK